ncbi:MAG: hypothetical protein EZS28_046580, partial [Streblomastix strix]
VISNNSKQKQDSIFARTATKRSKTKKDSIIITKNRNNLKKRRVKVKSSLRFIATVARLIVIWLLQHPGQPSL